MFIKMGGRQSRAVPYTWSVEIQVVAITELVLTYPIISSPQENNFLKL